MGSAGSSSKNQGNDSGDKMSSIQTIKLVHGRDKTTTCEIFLYGATVTSWKVSGEEMLYLSPKSAMDGSKAVRGGIPICFPNFGPWKFGAQHGFARTSLDWRVHHPPQVDDETGDVKAAFLLKDTDTSRSTWNFQFHFLYTITLKENSLHLEVEVLNKGIEKLDLTFCFHTYFKVLDILECRLSNFKGLTYTDKTLSGSPLVQEKNDPLQLSDFTDRVYGNAPNSVVLSGIGGGRKIRLIKEGLADFVVWNPWDKNKLADMPEEDFKTFICVEAAQNSQRVYLDRDETWSATHILTVT